jgi:hypothetical protein
MTLKIKVSHIMCDDITLLLKQIFNNIMYNVQYYGGFYSNAYYYIGNSTYDRRDPTADKILHNFKNEANI